MQRVGPRPIAVGVLLVVSLLAACGRGAAGSTPQAPGASGAPAAKQKVSVCTPGTTQSFAYLGIAQQLGYYEQLGIDADVQQVQGGVCTQALSSGNVQFAGSPSTLDAVIKGLPYRIVFVSVDRLGHQLIVARGINSYADLKGGRLAISGAGSLTDSLTRSILQENGLVPDQDVTFVSIGSPENRVSAVLSGAVQGSLLSAEEGMAALDQGLKTLPFAPRTTISAPLTTSEQLVQNNPDLIYRFVKGSLMGHLMYSHKKDQVFPLVMKYLSSDDSAYQERIYALTVPIWKEEADLDEQQQQELIARARATNNVARDFTPAQVFDFQFVHRAYQELKDANWEGLWSQ
ncbi:MAG TPA: ABC transporter substrate-binding protein [Chloroflexota bacterium]|nr:ABC transporter substrate-binding protein [Chloroflexota bacterium]